MIYNQNSYPDNSQLTGILSGMKWLEGDAFQKSSRELVTFLKNLESLEDKKKRLGLAKNIQLCQRQRAMALEPTNNLSKKVVSRDKIDYKFGNSFIDKNSSQMSYKQEKKGEVKKKQGNTKFVQKFKEAKVEFIHGDRKGQTLSNSKQRPLNHNVIKQIDFKDFNQKYSDVQFFQIFAKNTDEQQKFVSTFRDISQDYVMDEVLNKFKFSLIDHDSFYTAKSLQFLYKADEQLDFWRKSENQQVKHKAQQIEIMKRCQNFNPKQPSFLHLLDFAASKLDGKTLAYYFKLKTKLQSDMKINENQVNLQAEYNKKKQQYDHLRETKVKDKSQLVKPKTFDKQLQTDQKLQDKSFDSYFQQSARDIIIKINNLNHVRDIAMKKQQQQSVKKTMLVNIGYEIKSLLFRLLAFTLKGQDFVNYDEMIEMQDVNAAQIKVLEIIYHGFNKMKTLEVDGVHKNQILSIYLEQKSKNQRMFELLGLVYDKDNKEKGFKAKTKRPKKQQNENSKKDKPQTPISDKDKMKTMKNLSRSPLARNQNQTQRTIYKNQSSNSSYSPFSKRAPSRSPFSRRI